MNFRSFRFSLTIIVSSLLSFSLIKAQSIQATFEQTVNNQLIAIRPITLDLEEVTLVDAIERLKSITSAKGMPDFNVIYDLQSQEGLGNKPLTLRVDNVHAKFAFDKILQAFGLVAIYDDYAIRLIPSQGNNLSFITKKWQVPPAFLKNLATQIAGDPNTINTIAPQKPIDILKQLGVTLPEGSSIIYLASSNFLEARAPVPSIDIIDQFIRDAKQKEASQVSLRIKLITINQDELDQLGFDWTTGGFINLEGSSNIAGGAAISDTINSNLLDATTNLTTSPTRAGTAGNRTLTELSEFETALDDIVGDLNRIQDGTAARSRAPGVISYIDNLGTSEQVAVMLRALSQAKSFDVIESPHVVVSSGQKSSFFKGTEIKYPTAYDQAQISYSRNDDEDNEDEDNDELINLIPSSFAIAPAHPTDFETQKLGIELNVEPTLSANNQLINLTINPEFYEFQGFLSFGERILNVAYVDELYLDLDNDEHILVVQNIGGGPSFVLANVLGGVSNSMVPPTFNFGPGGNIETFNWNGYTNNITNIGGTTISVRNTQGGIDFYTQVFHLFQPRVFNYINPVTGPAVFSGHLLADLNSTDAIFYTVVPELSGRPYSFLVDFGFVYFVDPNDFEIYEATPNFVVQPIFDKTQLNTQVTLQSGETVLLGGVMQQNRIALDDSIPILGDIPILGQLFDSTGEDIEDKAILIFIEAVAQDPLGNPVAQ